jgi:1-acyl-sn-glycerol-3-phosphate acyltransferase
MNDKDYILPLPETRNRRNLVFPVARIIAQAAHRLLVTAHVELDAEVLRIRRQPNAVFFYVGLHKSLWETSGLLVPLYEATLPLPFVGMGDNLIHGRFFQSMAKRVGLFLIRRPSSRADMLESARRLRSDVLGYLGRGLDVLIFPEGTRKNVATRGTYGDFFPAAFEPLLEYERKKEKICAANPGMTPRDIYIVPLNVDYSQVREALELVDHASGRPQTLHVFDSLSMIRHIGHTYLSYGRPVRVADLLELDRKRLAAECRRQCLELVKILPINVACLAMLRLDATEPFAVARLEGAVRDVIAALAPRADRFRGFSLSDAPGEILRRARQRQVGFDHFDPERVPLYRLYADYVRHYLPAAPPSA